MFTMRSYFDRIRVFLIIILGNEVSGRFPWQSDFPVRRTRCHSPKCNAYATYLHDLLNYDVNPCDDFYQYVCGKWGEKNPLPDYYPHWGIDTQMAEKALERVKHILYTVPYHSSTELNQARELYEACMKIPYLGILDAKSLRSYIKFDHFPLITRKTEPLKNRKLSWLEVHNYYLSITGEPAFFSIKIVGDTKNNMKPTLRISPMDSPFGLIDSFEVLMTNRLILYKELLLAMVIHLIPTKMCEVSYTLIEKRLLDVLVFRRELWKIISENQDDSDDCHLMTVETFDSLYTSKKTISWVNIIYSLYNATDNLSSITSVNVCIEEKKYFDSLTQLLSKTDDDILVNHIHLYFIERHLKLTPDLKEMLLKVVIKNGKLEEQIRYLGIREFECLLMPETMDGFGTAYINRYFPKGIKRKGELLVNKLKDVMKVLIGQSTWLDADTKNKAIVKISKMKMAIGYPEYYDDPTLRSEYDRAGEQRVRVITSDVFYLPMTNRLSISATYFNPPLYDPTFPPSVVYGTIGGPVGHEMYHAFGPCTLYCESLPVDWSRNMLSKYDERIPCFVELYDNKTVKELRHIPDAPTIDGHRTLDENLADTMGLNLAYWAFRKEVWTSKMCRILRGPPNLTCDQLFFVSYALNFCTSSTVDRLMEVVQEEKHCPDDFRLNGAVSNLEEFSKAFNCSKEAPMNPSKRCNLWI